MKTNPCILKITGDGSPSMLVGELAFNWKVEQTEGYQKAYTLTVNERNGGCIWNSGRIETDRSAGIPYTGNKLKSNTDYEAQVTVEACDGTLFVSEKAGFSTGLLDVEREWTAKWLTSPYISFAVAPVFCKHFRTDKPVRRARLYICGLGYYQLYVNGRQIGDRYMDPAWTDYNKRVNYVAYDLSQQIALGENAIGICLGSGWYSNYSAKPRTVFSLQLMLEYADGSCETIASGTDGSWLALEETWMLENTLYVGEVVDSRKYIDGWCEADFAFDKGTWRPAIAAEPPAGKLVPMRVEPIRSVGEITAVEISEPQAGVYVVDFGQNMAGIVELKLHDCVEGDTVKIRFSELIDEKGMLNTENLRKAQQCDTYIAHGGEEVYKPSFTYHGFRYAEVTGLRSALRTEDIKAYVVRTDVAVRSNFETSDPLINDIQRICAWTENNNMHSVPTDCPQRDERLGWMNDLTVRLEEQMFNFDVDAFLNKFMVDIMDEQGETTGAITDTVPYVNFGSQPADPVCSSYVLIPYMLYKHYGDRYALEKAWPGIKAWTDYLASCRVNGIVGYSYYGDWAAPMDSSVRFSAGNGAVSAVTPGGLMSTGFLYLNCRILSEIAGILGYTDEKETYARLVEDAARSLNETYLMRDSGFYATNSQASNTFMLYLGIVPEDLRNRVLQNLVDDILSRDTHLSTGNICSRYILDVLADAGKIDLAYALATQTSYPSWGYMLSKGATTTWERWEYVDSGELVGMASHDHPMYSTISGWFHKYLAGIRAEGAGFDRFELRPYYPSKLDRVSDSMNTVKGTLTVEWERKPGQIEIRVEIPFNSGCKFVQTCEGELLVDGKAMAAEKNGPVSVNLDSGKHVLVINN